MHAFSQVDTHFAISAGSCVLSHSHSTSRLGQSFPFGVDSVHRKRACLEGKTPINTTTTFSPLTIGTTSITTAAPLAGLSRSRLQSFKALDEVLVLATSRSFPPTLTTALRAFPTLSFGGVVIPRNPDNTRRSTGTIEPIAQHHCISSQRPYVGGRQMC